MLLDTFISHFAQLGLKHGIGLAITLKVKLALRILALFFSKRSYAYVLTSLRPARSSPVFGGRPVGSVFLPGLLWRPSTCCVVGVLGGGRAVHCSRAVPPLAAPGLPRTSE